MLRRSWFGISLGSLCTPLFSQQLPGAPEAPKDGPREAGKDSLINVAKGIPPRATPADYQAQGKLGPITLAAEFVRHAVPTPEAVYNSEDYVVMEVGFFGPAGARTVLSSEHFAIRINARKMPTPSVLPGAILASLNDPNWEPPIPPEGKGGGSKGGISTGGGGAAGEPKPLPPKMPMPLRLIMSQRVQRAALMAGDRALPQAGLLFFPYRGKPESIHNLELIYTGPAGTVTIPMEP